MLPTQSKVHLDVSLGGFIAEFSENGLRRLRFPQAATPVAALCSESPLDVPDAIRHWVSQTAKALERALAGKPSRELPPLDLGHATLFQRQVWKALRTIPLGETRTYIELAHAIGLPSAARAVGRACGANPIPVLIPCHRVVAAGGRLGGFSGGLAWKRRLLAVEATPF